MWAPCSPVLVGPVVVLLFWTAKRKFFWAVWVCPQCSHAGPRGMLLGKKSKLYSYVAFQEETSNGREFDSLGVTT